MTRLVLLLILIGLPQPCLALVLKFYAESLPPYHFTDDKGQPTGALVEIIEATAKEAAIVADVRLMPFARGYQQMLTDNNSFMFSLLRTAQREKKMRWVGQIYRTDAWLVGLSGRNGLQVKSLDEAKKKVVGTIRGYHSEKFLKSKGFVENRNLFLSVNYKLMWHMLYRQRIDYVLTNTVSLETEITSLGLDVKAVQKYYEVRHFPGELFIVTNLNTPMSHVKRLSEALDRLKADGRYQRIIDKWQL